MKFTRNDGNLIYAMFFIIFVSTASIGDARIDEPLPPEALINRHNHPYEVAGFGVSSVRIKKERGQKSELRLPVPEILFSDPDKNIARRHPMEIDLNFKNASDAKKEFEITQPAKESRVVKNSEASALMAGEKAGDRLIDHGNLQAMIGGLPFEKVSRQGFRFYYKKFSSNLYGHTWYFDKYDLRGKIVRISYSGIVPEKITFKFMSSPSSAAAIFQCHLKNSRQTETAELQIPETQPFGEASILRLLIDKANAGKKYADFIIEKIEVLKNETYQSGVTLRDPAYAYAEAGLV